MAFKQIPVPQPKKRTVTEKPTRKTRKPTGAAPSPR